MKVIPESLFEKFKQFLEKESAFHSDGNEKLEIFKDTSTKTKEVNLNDEININKTNNWVTFENFTANNGQ